MRYLLNFSYIGSSFRGTQKISNKLSETNIDTSTVQGSIEFALGVLRPSNEIRTALSSRTDAGVHGLHSTLHVDLQRYNSDLPYDPTGVTGCLNRILEKNNLPIRILNTQLVPDTFHCRYHAKYRTYLYRLAVAKEGVLSEGSRKNSFYEAFVPVEELSRCLFLQKYLRNKPFDVDRMKSASKLFLGRHDFRTFMSTDRNKKKISEHPMFAIRTITEVKINPGKSLAVGLNAVKANEIYNYWDIEITGKSFVYKQVRRIVGTLLAISFDQINEKGIYEMLTIPSKNSWDPRVMIVPSLGLYLCKVHYDEKDFQFPSQSKN